MSQTWEAVLSLCEMSPVRSVPNVMRSLYTGDVVKRLETIAATAKMAVNEIAIVDYNHKVA